MNAYIKYLLSSIFLFACFELLAQENADSIRRILVTAKEDTNKVYLLRILGATVNNQNPSEGAMYQKQSIALAKKLNYWRGIQAGYVNLATTYNILSKVDSCIIFCDSSLFYAKYTDNSRATCLAYLTKGSSLYQLNKFKQAIESINQALLFADKINSEETKGGAYSILGNVYYSQKQYEMALLNYQRSLDIFRSLHKIESVAAAYVNMANVYDDQHDYKKAKGNYLAAIQIQKDLEDSSGLHGTYHNLAICSENLLEFKEAEFYYKAALSFAVKLKDENEASFISANYGAFLTSKKRYDEAEKILLPALQLAIKNKEQSTEDLLLDALAELYEVKGNHALAYKYLKRSAAIKDSMNTYRLNEDVLTLQTKFETAEKDNQIELLNKDKKIQEEYNTRQHLIRNMSIVAFMIAILLILLIFHRYRAKQKIKELTVRNKIASDLHDDIGSTLSSVSFMSEFVKQQAHDTAPHLIPFVEKMGSNSREMIEAMNDIVWSIDPANDTGEKLIARMDEFMQTIFQGKNTLLHLNTNADIRQMNLDASIRKNIFLLFKEAINNAAKYSECTKLDVNMAMNKRLFKLSIEDNGCGFDLQHLERVNGLDNMKRRAAELKGNFNIESHLNQGTKIYLDFYIT